MDRLVWDLGHMAMACLQKISPLISSSSCKPIKTHHQQQQQLNHQNQNVALLQPISISRRSSSAAAILISVLPLTLIANPQQSVARERRNRKTIPLEDYQTTRLSIPPPYLLFYILFLSLKTVTCKKPKLNLYKFSLEIQIIHCSEAWITFPTRNILC